MCPSTRPAHLTQIPWCVLLLRQPIICPKFQSPGAPAPREQPPAPFFYSVRVFLCRITQIQAFLPFWGPASPGMPWTNAPSEPAVRRALKRNFSPNRRLLGYNGGFPDPVPSHLCNFLALPYVT